MYLYYCLREETEVGICVVCDMSFFQSLIQLPAYQFQQRFSFSLPNCCGLPMNRTVSKQTKPHFPFNHYFVKSRKKQVPVPDNVKPRRRARFHLLI